MTIPFLNYQKQHTTDIKKCIAKMIWYKSYNNQYTEYTKKSSKVSGFSSQWKKNGIPVPST